VGGQSNQELQLHLAGGGGGQGYGAVAARRSLTPNALGAAPVRAREEESTGQCSQGCTDQHLEERFP
jgi:hypothetical protein